jgi:hypothetical protein
MNRISWRSIDLDAVSRFCLLTGIFLTVVVFDLQSIKPFDTVKFAAIWCFGSLAIGIWVIQLIRGKARRVPTPSGRNAGLFLAAVGIATLFSHTRVVSFFGEYQRYGGFLTTALFVSLFLLIVNRYRGNPDHVRELLYVLGEASIVVTAYILLQWLDLDPINWSRASGRVTKHVTFGTLGNSNFAGGFLGLMVPWLWYAYRRARAPWLRVVVVLWSAAHLWALWLTSARGALVAVGAGVGAILLMYHRQLPSWTKITAAVATGVVLVLVLLVVWHPGSDRPPGPLAEVRVLRSQTLAVRAYWWLAGVRLFASDPVVGTGPDSFVAEYPRRMPSRSAQIPDSEAADKPHNVFVEYAASTGVLGLGAYLLLVVGAFRRGLRRRRETVGDERLLLTAFLATLAAYLGQAFFSIDMIPLAMSGWIALAGVVALSEAPAEARAALRARGASLRRTAGIVGVAFLTVAVFAYGALRLQADHDMKTGARLTQIGAPVNDIVSAYQRAISIAPYEPVYRGVVGDFLQKHAAKLDDRREKQLFLETSVRTFEKMNDLQPGMHLWKMTLAQAIADLAAVGGSMTFDDADEMFRQAQRLGPHDWRVPVAWGGKLNLRATATRRDVFRCLARDQFNRAVSLRPIETKPWLGLGETFVALGRLSRAAEAFQNAVNNAKIDQDRVAARQALDGVLRKTAQVRADKVELKRIRCS